MVGGVNRELHPDDGIGVEWESEGKEGLVMTLRRTPLDVAYRGGDQDPGLKVALGNYASIMGDPQKKGVLDFWARQAAEIEEVEKRDPGAAAEMTRLMESIRS